MLILLPALLLFAPALAIALLRFIRPAFRSSWLIAVGFVFFSWISVVLLEPQLPISTVLPTWKLAEPIPLATAFIADGLSWPFAMSLVTLAVALLVTALAREDFPNSLSWGVSLTLCGLGLLAVTANNPLTIVIVWAALDLAEVIIYLRASNERTFSQRAVIAFAIRAAGIMLAMLAQVVASSTGKTVNLVSLPPQAGLLLVAAAGLRLGVLPIYSAYGSENVLPRDIGSVLRLVSAAASLVVLARIPTESLASPLTLPLLILALIAAFYGGWMWLRAPDELIGRPYWVIGFASLAVAAALRGNPVGATAWGATLILAGGALFLSSLQHLWLKRFLLIGAWSASSLPFSLTASGWNSGPGSYAWSVPAFIIPQALLMAGFIRQSLRPSSRPISESRAAAVTSVYSVGIGFLLFVQLLLGVWGWNGALEIGNWIPATSAVLLTFGLLWAVPRFPVLNPIPVQRQHSTGYSRLDKLYISFWSLHHWLRGPSEMISNALEGEGGIIWTLLFLILFISLIVERHP